MWGMRHLQNVRFLQSRRNDIGGNPYGSYRLFGPLGESCEDSSIEEVVSRAHVDKNDAYLKCVRSARLSVSNSLQGCSSCVGQVVPVQRVSRHLSGERMTSLVQFFRFLVGLGMVIAGGVVAAPLISSILSAATSGPVPSGQVRGAAQGRTSQSPIHAFTVPGSVPIETDPVQYTYDSVGSSLSPPNGISLLPKAPIGLPERMPKQTLGATPPDLYGAYRTTVEMPPPPLLDGSQDVAKYRMDRTTESSKGPRRQVPDSIPETYRVRDGDDLTGIATRLYGHPRAATALWQVNANRLSSPEVLPIGFEMVVPPAWRVFGKSAADGDAYRIEPVESPRMEVPRGASVHATSMQSNSLVKQNNPSLNQGPGNPWLERAQKLHPVHPEKTITTESRGTIRVAPGETLVSLAQRVYGDATMADSIFNANRDRLRNPALLVPGTELRLP